MADFPLVEGQRYDNAGFQGTYPYGTSCISGGSAHVKGNWAQLIASLPFDITQIIFFTGTDSASALFLIDIGIGASGSEVVLIPNIHVGGLLARCAYTYTFPITIPAGTRVAFRCQCSTANSTLRSWLLISAQGLAPSQPLGRVTTYGANTATSRGTQIDPGGTIDTKGSWYQINSATANPIKIMTIGTGNIANATMTTCQWAVDIGIGAAGSEVVIIPNLQLLANTTTDTIVQSTFPLLAVDIPAGVRLAVRAQCSINDATNRLFDIVIHGID